MSSVSDDMLYRKLKQFSEINRKFCRAFDLVSNQKSNDETKKREYLLQYLAHEILTVPEYFDETLERFSEEFPKLLHMATSDEACGRSERRHVLVCILLAKVLRARKDLHMYALKYFNEHPSVFEFDQGDVIKRSKSDDLMYTDLDIVEATYFILKSNPDFYRNKWKWSIFIKKYFSHDDPRIRWLSCHILAILFGFYEHQLYRLLHKTVQRDAADKFLCAFAKSSTLNDPCTITTPDDYLSSITIVPSPSDDFVVCISGVYLSVLPDGPGFKLPLVEVSSTYNNLRKVALGLMANRAICLQGPVGSGKTSLVEFLAGKTGRRLGESFVKVQLGDQTDSKMLLGTYRCTDVPGEFVWQAGVLTQAVLEGSWLLLEDIDSASMDIASVLSSLLENRTLTVPGYRDSIPVAPSFQLFVTQRLVTTISGHHKKHSNAMSLLEKYLLHINVDPLSPEELKVILNTWYEPFRTVSDRMIDVFLLFNSYETKPSGRLISTRDFFKWCSRAIIDFNVSSQESALKVLQDAIDVFCCSYSNPEEALNLAKKISTHLGIINQKAEYFFKTYKPTMRLTPEQLIAGRISLNRTNKTLTAHLNYSFTRPSSVLIERIMCCIRLKEPVLLVGETGTGKTSCVQYLANVLGQKLIVINMNQQSDSADLLGGFKPVDLKLVIGPIRKEFESVFCDYFKVEPNRKYLGNVALCFNKERWSDLLKLMNKSCQAALERLRRSERAEKDQEFLRRWRRVSEKLHKLDLQLKHKSALAFAFIEGSLVKAVENGHWVLLDEINLANAETLECLSGLLEGTRGSLCLLERGDKKPVERHQDFTLFACMNPSTDVGKKDLPAGLRNRFTEFFVDELNEKTDLLLLVNNYLEAMSLKQKELESIVDFYLKVRKEAINSLSDGSGHRPHFSLRSLCRALTVASKNPCGTFKRGLYEAFCLSFLTQLDSRSYQVVESLIARYTIGDQRAVKAVLKQPIPKPSGPEGKFLQFEGYWVEKGGLEPEIPEEYVLTESVRKNLKDLTRVVSIGRLPVLLQGDTSVGKTSLITYLAKSSGNRCVRINNHEHTDLQEYIGSYVANLDGKLIFREGLLVEAMRKGHWIILDELNLAPTDVLEALNRVLDDNRELFILETQQTVKANENFMLFATQNPPGAYGGRKMLSRAFRNRFVELHFNEIPAKELEFILHRRCKMAPSYSKKMIAVMTELQVRRKGSTAFAGKHGFITLRDLFRWGERYRLAEDKAELYDWDQHLADEGYLVLAGRVRKGEERKEIVEVLEKHLKRKVEPERLFTLSPSTSVVTRHVLEKIEANKHKDLSIVWTYSMRQLAVLVSKAIEFNEPILLVGETGGGKTTVCKLIAEFNNQRLISVNCHMHTESGDFIGGLRPVRDHSSEESATKLFEWVNGPLIDAMVQGQVFLADEISLADDSVLERLNSLLEPERTLLLAEKGIDLDNSNNSETIVAHPGFVFIGTMNPGGDFGKKELSPALRNRFTEIWCEPCTDRADLIDIIERNLKDGIKLGDRLQDGSSGIGKRILDFLEWFGGDEIGKRITVSIRDILTWTNFINACANSIGAAQAYIHGADLTFLDSLGSGVTSTENSKSLNDFKQKCREFLHKQALIPSIESSSELKVTTIDDKFGVHPFYIKTAGSGNVDFSFNAPTTLKNTAIILRAMQLEKAILLEGSPGVGKTGLVTALAKVTGHRLYRVNLSDQTDVSDLFGADLPVEGGKGGQFSWRDGPLLQALKDGDWILLDELNLASQSVLEGLNACLDHRGEIFVPELGKTFYVKPGTKFFACQNPLKQGGARRGLPRSFLNRFTQVYVQPLTGSDMSYILTGRFETIPPETIEKMIEFNSRIASGLDGYEFGHKGAPWECNLRDLTRWCESTLLSDPPGRPESTVGLIYADRMRTPRDKSIVLETFAEVFRSETSGVFPLVYLSLDEVYVGDARIVRTSRGVNEAVLRSDKPCLVLRSQTEALRSLAWCVNMNWMAIVVGSSGTGKSSIVKTLANLYGKTLRTLPVTSAMDTSDLLGGFEQSDYGRHLDEIAREVERHCLEVLQESLVGTGKGEGKVLELLERWQTYVKIRDIQTQTMDEELRLFLEKSAKLQGILRCLEKREDRNLDDLRDRLGKLSRTAKADGSLNAGGKFEWVDSILVKCLRDGSWLLIDNVNLCSSAVLDRLNSLLEPNGVLTLSERGVDADGRTIEIRPHPDFRLFLTMDPKNGEVSRAMRNRGVEICLASPRPTNELDLMSLVRLEGLTDPSHIALLLKTHEFIASIVHGEAPRVNELLQLASSVSQQLIYGSELREAVSSCAAEVYCKTRSPGEFSCADPVNVISCEVSGFAQQTEAARKVGFSINVGNLNSASNLEKLAQQFCAYEEDSVYSILIFYSMSSKEDLPLREVFLKQSVRNDDLSSLIDALDEVAKSSNFGDATFPFDLNWFPQVPYKSTKVEDSNRYNLNLYLEVFKFLERMEYSERKIQDVKIKEITLFDYMLNKQRKKLQDNFNDVIVDNYLRIEREYDQYLKTIVDGTTTLNNANFITTLYFVMWRFIFRKSTLRNVRSVNPDEKSELMLHLQVHFRWFLKYSIEGVGEVTNIPPSEGLNEVLKQIRSRLDKQFSSLQQLGKTYQKVVERPKPYLTHQQLETAETYEEISKCYDLYTNSCDFSKIIDCFTREKNLRPLLIEIKSRLHDSDDLLDKISSLKTVHESLTSRSDDSEAMRRDLSLLRVSDALLRLRVQTDGDFSRSDELALPLDMATSCAFEYNKAFYLYLLKSPSVRGLSAFAPKLAYFVTGVIKEGKVGLGEVREEERRRNLVNLAVWANMRQISEEQYDFLTNELERIKSTYSAFLQQLTNVLFDSNSQEVTFEAISLKLRTFEADPDLQNLTKHLEDCDRNIGKLSPQGKFDETLHLIAELYMKINLIKAAFNSRLPLIDPLVKKSLKRKHIGDISGIFQRIKRCYEVQNMVFSDERETRHIYCKRIEDKLEELKDKEEKLGRFVAVRSKDVSYNSVVMNVEHAFTTILSPATITKTISNLRYLIINLSTACTNRTSIDFNHFTAKVNHYESTALSYENLLHDWSKYRTSYPDMVEPLLSNVAEFLYGLRLQLSLLKLKLVEYKYVKSGVELRNDLGKVLKFPVLGKERGEYEGYVDGFGRLEGFVREALREEEGESEAVQKLWKCGMYECFNLCVIDASNNSHRLDKTLFNKFVVFMDKFVSSWNRQQIEKERKETEAESLYKMKTKCVEKSDDEITEDEIKSLFTNFHDKDFPDLQPDTIQESEPIQETHEENFTWNDLKEMISLHQILVKNYVRTEWLNPETDKNVGHDFIRPLVTRFEVFGKILEKDVDGLDYQMDDQIVGSLCTMLGVARKYGDTTDLTDLPSSPSRSSKKPSDFYRDSNVVEVKSCYHILEELRLKVEEFLQEWPEQPTLKLILSVIDRIYSFDLKSPLARFLTGLEILLTKCHEWEQVAHSKISLSHFYKSLIDQIVSWRKLELSMWKDLLSRTYERMNDSLPKWWIYLYNVMRQFIYEKMFDKHELLSTLQNFITKSNMAEFHSRLDLLYVFHCHSSYLERTKESKEFNSILWNLHSYFQQFNSTVSNKIKDLRSPIEKQLKDYVKIVRWKDVSYWSVKQTVDKSHKTLHKYVKEFQNVLQQPVTPYLTNTHTKFADDNVGIWDRPQRQNPKTYHYTLDAESYVTKQSKIKKFLSSEEGLLGKIETYFMKSRILCRDTISSTEYPELIQNLDGFVGEVIETSSHLQNLEVDTTLSKAKQKSQAKNILQQKHRALADLFKTLRRIGLSFKGGVVQRRLKGSCEDFLIKPVDLSVNFNRYSHNCREEKILTMWDSCELYYVRSLMRSDVLDGALLNPAKDLGLQNIDRCKGLSSDLLLLAQKLKTSLITSTRSYYYLKHCVKQLTEFSEGKDFLHQDLVQRIKTVLRKVSITLKQIKIVLNTCPEQGLEQLEVPVLDSKVPDRIEYKHDDHWTRSMEYIDSTLSISTKLIGLIVKSEGIIYATEHDPVTPKFVPVSDQELIKNDLQEVSKGVVRLSEVVGNGAMVESLSWLKEEIDSTISKFDEKVFTDDDEEISDDTFKRKLEKLMETILLTIQNIYKKYSKGEKEVTSSEDKLMDDHLRKLLIENLINDMELLEVPNVLERTRKVAEIVLRTHPEGSSYIKSMTVQALPLLEQTVQMYQYFITQQVSGYRVVCKMSSVLFNIFIELASKGFCVPPEFSDELQGEGEGRPSDGLGLGEGEGKNDVSDRIESEDQLDEARPAGEEKEKEEEKECQEEDKGIEMSEDFEGKMQDKAKKDEENDQSSDSEADEQMGETEKGADRLDQEIWGSDTEEPEEGEDKEYQGDGGEKKGDDQLGAKEDQQKEEEKDEEKGESSSSEEKKKKEINEMEEPEYDDDQLDPHHGNQPELPEPEPMDLPDDLQLDDGVENEDQEAQEENPFDIEKMKESVEEQTTLDDEEEKLPDDKEGDEAKDFSSDDEDVIRGEEERDDMEKEDDSKEVEENVKEESVSEDQKEQQDEEEKKGDESSGLDQNQSHQENVQAMDIEDITSTDITEDNPSTRKSNEPIDELIQEDNRDEDGVGQSQTEESKSGHTAQTSSDQELKGSKRETEEEEEREEKKKRKPGESDSQRSLGDVNEPVKKKLKTKEARQESGESEDKEEQQAEMYQHIKDANEKRTQVLDVATEEQVEKQRKEVPNKEDEEAEAAAQNEEELPMEEEIEESEVAGSERVESEEVESASKKKSNKREQHKEGDILDEPQEITTDGSPVDTLTAPRDSSTTHHTSNLTVDPTPTRLTTFETDNLRSEVERQLSTWKESPSNQEAEQTWQKISSVTASLARDLSEQLRLVLEPTKASRLKGDFRTGKRINMRKVIPYVASEFRKDKIWLRRTKPSKREYQIVIAIDDSSSMSDNRSKELAFESVSLISKALTLLETGELSVLSFGEKIEVIHKLSEQFTDNSGVKLLRTFNFDQNKTCVGKLLDFATEMLDQSPNHQSINSKLLVIVSDGRGVFSEGETYVRRAVRRAWLADVFVVFVIIDNPENKSSILDIRMPVFKDGKLSSIQSYMDAFPFSFYIILRDIGSLPSVLSDALRQWFEIVSNLNK